MPPRPPTNRPAGRPRTKTPAAPSQFILSSARIDELRKQGREVNVDWTPNRRPDGYSMQEDGLLRLEDEILCAGGVGGGKSELARRWLLRGNPELPDEDENGNPILVNQSYIYHPHYHGLILRRNFIDLQEFIDRAQQLYCASGASYVNKRFEWPTGAIIDCGHLEDKDAWQKYIGQEYQRIVIEEAATIPEYELYEEIRARLRSPYPELRRQILLTANPKGPGVGWLLKRFMEVKDEKGNIIPPRTPIVEKIRDPRDGTMRTRTRIWLFSTVLDNPHLDTDYIINLASMDEKRREAYLLGNWRAYSGEVFKAFRPKGPQEGEPAWANHVVKATETPIPYWWPRSIGMDWGHKHHSAVYWAAQNPSTKQIFVYREFVVSGMTPETLGYEIAMRSREELMNLPTHMITMHLSPDAFADRTGGKSVAEMIGMGMARVLGGQAIHIPDIVISKLRKAYENGDATAPADSEETFAELRKQRKLGVTIKRAIDDRIIGWQLIQEYLRFDIIGGQLVAGYDAELAMRILSKDGLGKYLEYTRSFSLIQNEVLPKLQILDSCPDLIESIPKAVYNEPPKNTEDLMKTDAKHDDVLDSCLVGDTLVATEHGEIPIKDVRVGDRVWTRKGLRRVLAAGMTNPSAEIWRVETLDGGFLEGTGNHPVFVKSRGFVPLDTLKYSDILQVWKTTQSTSKSLNLRETSTDAIPAQRGDTFATTIGQVRPWVNKRSIGRFGSQSMARFQKDSISTTRTVTLSTTPSRIWKRSLSRGTSKRTWMKRDGSNCESLPKLDVSTQRSGIGVRRVALGTGNTVDIRAKRLQRFVSSVVENMRRPRPRGRNGVPVIAGRQTVESERLTTRRGYASCAIRSLGVTSTRDIKPALENVQVLVSQRLSVRRPVYNLSVEGEEEYFANGILVHNCRYLLVGMRDEDPIEPFISVWERRHAELISANPSLDFNSKCRIYDAAKRAHEGEQRGPIKLARFGRRARHPLLQ